jgi:dTDP-4-amino-4,6-dideoxygalactose transaminase
MDGLQAAILSAKLPNIQKWNDTRLENAKHYTELLKNVVEVVCPKVRPNTKHTFHVYVLRVQKRTELQAFLKENGIETQIHYPLPLPFVKAYSYLQHKPSDFPVASAYQSKILSLPMYPELKKEEIEYIASKIKAFYAKK